MDDDDLDYIGRNDDRDETRNTDDVTQTEGGEIDPDYCPRPTRNRSIRSDQSVKPAMPSRKKVATAWRDKNAESGQRSRKSETPKASGSVKGGKKKTKDKERKERNKTLTQMDFVQRWVKLESDDDTALDYMYYTPKDRRKSHESHGNTQDTEDICDDGNSSASKRRKLDEDHDSKDTKVLENVPLEKNPSTNPVTPQKPRKLEIPSSQSPESPGFAIISASQFRSATRSPLKGVPVNIPRVVQKESPGSRQEKKRSLNSDHASQAESTMSTMSRSLPNSQTIPQLALHDTSMSNNIPTPSLPRTKLSTSEDGSGATDDPQSDSATRKRRERTVVYETDGETDSGDFQDDLPSSPTSPDNQPADDGDETVGNNYDPYHDGSQILPPPPEADFENGPTQSEPPMSSDASICYRRIEKPTQFPLEPIPKLNTQKMAELFPQDSSGQAENSAVAETQSYPSTKPQSSHEPRAETQAQDMDNMSTEMVPESSPVARRDDEANADIPTTDEPRTKSVVQVESSQPADRFTKHANPGDTYPPGIISRNEFLSSSVMESIPVPQFLMNSSQDSVGEPYSIPEG